jgi:hypothetical protein
LFVSAFLEACDRRQAEVFALLLPKLSDEQVRDTTGLDNMSALGLALRRGDVEMVRALLGRGARANGNRRYSVQPLCLAVSVRYPWLGNDARTHHEGLDDGAVVVGRRLPTGESWWTCCWNTAPMSTRATGAMARRACTWRVG